MGIMSEDIERVEDSDRVRDLIWKHMGVKSAREIAELTGVGPEVVLRIKKELLEEVDILSIQEKRQRIVVELDGMARDARERAQGMSDEFYASGIQASVAAMRLILGELKLMEKQDSAKVETLNQKRVQELLSLMTAVVESGAQEIADVHGLNEDELLGVFNRKLVEEAGKRDLP